MNAPRDLTVDLAVVLVLAGRQIQSDALTSNVATELEALDRIQGLHDRLSQHQERAAEIALPKSFVDITFGRERG